jgi:hypothetical protein
MAARRVSARWSVVCVGAGLCLWSAVVFEGCRAVECEETATCPDGEDGGDAAVARDDPADSADSATDATVPVDSAADHVVAEVGSIAEAGRDEAAVTSDGGGSADAEPADACVRISSVEDCTNGIDDDCNGAVDCADAHCQALGFSCVPQWPGAGAWTAPVALYDLTVPGGPAPTPPSCAGYYASDVLDGRGVPVAAPANCGCSCGPVRDAGCSVPSVSVWTSQGCSGTTYASPVAADGGCTVVESTQDGINAGQIVDGGAPNSGSCTAVLDASAAAWDPGTSAAWAETGRVCAASGRAYLAGAAGGCGAGLVCVEPAPATFGGGKICLLSSGQVACPVDYAVEHTYFDGGLDTRACSDGCACGAPADVVCQAAVSLYSNGNCSGTAQAILATCTNTVGGSLGSNNRVSATASASASGGVCPSSAGATAPTGDVTASTGVTTVCCQP